MTYDPIHKEILFVEANFPHKIQSTIGAISPHTVIDQPNTTFDVLSVDSITGNIYYIDNG